MEFLLNNLLVVLAMIVLVLIIAGIVNLGFRKRKDNTLGKISFRETVDLAGIPIVTFMHNGDKFNFLLDTGASYSIINQAELQRMKYEFNGEKGSIMGSEGNISEELPYISACISYKDRDYQEEFQVADLSQSFGIMKEDFGVNLHGILGSAFFQKYRYVLDFDELVAYSMI